MTTLNRRAALAALGAATLLPALAAGIGCSRGAASLRLSDAEYLTVETLERVLLGSPQSERDLRPQTAEAPLLKRGVYEKVVIAADAAAFAGVSKGGVKEKDIQELSRRVVGEVDRLLRKQGFSASGATYPAQVTEERTLVATLTPETQDAGSPSDRASGKTKPLVLVRLTVTDPRTGEVLARRDYYSGADVKK